MRRQIAAHCPIGETCIVTASAVAAVAGGEPFQRGEQLGQRRAEPAQLVGHGQPQEPGPAACRRSSRSGNVFRRVVRGGTLGEPVGQSGRQVDQFLLTGGQYLPHG